MKALMSADTVGGVFTYAVDLAAGLRRLGVDVVLVTFGRRMSAEQRARVTAAGVGTVHETDLALEWMDDPWDDLQAAEELLLETERLEQPDVVHLNGFVHGSAPFSAPVLVAGHSCVCSWWQAVHGQAPPPAWDRYRRAVGAGLAAADAVVAPSQAMLDALGHWYGPLPARAGVIPNASAYAGPRRPPVKEPLVLAAGRLWDEAKNIGALLRAAARDEGLRGRVLLAGEGGAEGDATHLGVLTPDELARVRRRAAVYAAPAKYEPFGLAILEAARDRCALVLGDIPSLREIWDDSAVYVDPADDARLAAALRRLLDDPAAAATCGSRAHAHARRYAVDAMAGAYRELYRTLAAASHEVAA